LERFEKEFDLPARIDYNRVMRFFLMLGFFWGWFATALPAAANDNPFPPCSFCFHIQSEDNGGPNNSFFKTTILEVK
jgi:hypothetical protein